MPAHNKMSPARYAVLVRSLTEGAYTARELADLTELHYITVLDYVNALHDEGMVHVERLERDALGRESIKVFRFGPGEDALPQPLSRAAQQRRYRARKQARELEQQQEQKERKVPQPSPAPRRRVSIHDL